MKSNKIFIIAAIILVAGMCVFVAGFAAIGFDFKKLSTEAEFEQKEYISPKNVSSVVVSGDNIPISFEKSDSDAVRVEYSENKNYGCSISLSDEGVLTVKWDRKVSFWKIIFSFSFDRPTVRVFLPESFQGDISADTDNGKITLISVYADDVEADTSNGSIIIEDSVISGRLKAETNNGSIELTSVEAGDISTETDNGKIVLSSVKSKSDISAITDNHSISLDRVEFAGDIICRSSNGSIKGCIVGHESDFLFDCRTSNGDCNLPEDFGLGEKMVKLITSNGDIDISFTTKDDFAGK